MATSSFDDNIVITDSDTIAEMKEILDDPNIKMIDKEKLPNYTSEQAKENARKWTPDADLERILAPIEIRTEEQVESFLDAWDKAEANIGKYDGNIHILTPEEIREKFKDRLKDKEKKNKE